MQAWRHRRDGVRHGGSGGVCGGGIAHIKNSSVATNVRKARENNSEKRHRQRKRARAARAGIKIRSAARRMASSGIMTRIEKSIKIMAA